MKNPFKKVHILSSNELIDYIFSSASDRVKKLNFDVRKTRYGTTRMKSVVEIVSQKEGVRISSCANKTYSKLIEVVRKIPNENDIPDIYMQFMNELVGFEKIVKCASRIKKTANYSKKLQGKYLDKLKRARNTSEMRVIRKEFYGRLSGMIKKIDKDLKFLSDSMSLLSKLPDLKDCRTVVLIGFPNVGKTSLLKKLTGSAPEIKPYPFTTKGIMIGYMHWRHHDIQIIDTPGILDKSKKNKIEIHTHVALKKIGDMIIYIFDISETCGYTISQQMKFYNKIKRDVNKQILAVINKIDVVGVSPIERITKKIDAIPISCERGDGIREIKKIIINNLYN